MPEPTNVLWENIKMRIKSRCNIKGDGSASFFLRFLIFMAIAFGVSIPAFAELRCTPTDGRSILLSLGKDTPAIKVTPGIPLGTVLFSKTYNFSASCALTKPNEKEVGVYFFRKNLSQSLGYGLTLNVNFNGNKGDMEQTIATGWAVSNWWGIGGGSTNHLWAKNMFSADIEIVKTSNSTQPGTVAKSLDLFSIGGTSVFETGRAVYTMQNPSSVVYTTETCKVRGPGSFTVQLDKASLNKNTGFGSGIGSFSKSTDFSIKLLCDTDIASTFKVMLKLDATSPVGGAQYGLLSPTPDTSSAHGVALQLLDGNTSQPAKFGTAWQIGSFPVSGANIDVPFSVRYYQIEQNVTPGTVNSTMIYTITYL